MRILLTVVTAIGMLGMIAGAVLAQSGNELFSQALSKERTEGNMAEAIKLYQSIVQKYSSDRTLVAKALVQMGLSYEKLGNVTDARKAFDRVAREYKDQREAAEANAHLNELNLDRAGKQVGAIRGRVIGRDTEQAQVFALKTVYRDGQRLMQSVLSARTNDRGEYDLSPLLPGKYYVATAIHATGTDGRENYGMQVPIFFPNSPDQHRAKQIEVRPGATISQSDIQIVPVPLRRIRGTVTGIGPFAGPEDPIRGQPLNVTMMMKNELPTALMSGHPTARVDSNGSFEFPVVPAGSYVLSVHQNYANGGQVAIDVTDHDVTGINIPMVPGLTVSGRIVIDPPTAAVPSVFTGGLLARVTLRGDPPLRGSILHNATMRDNGTFKFPGGSRPLQVGDYRVSFEPILTPPIPLVALIPGNVGTPVSKPQLNVYVKSIRLGDADVLNDGLHLDSQPRQELVIVLGANPGMLEGRVINARRKPIPRGTVVLIPEGGIRFRVDHKFTATDASGRFRLERIPPGDYKVFAWQEVEKDAWQDPDFVRPYESRGKLIHIKEGDKQLNVEVTGIPPAPR